VTRGASRTETGLDVFAVASGTLLAALTETDTATPTELRAGSLGLPAELPDDERFSALNACGRCVVTGDSTERAVASDSSSAPP
jgi:hypothetical protein